MNFLLDDNARNHIKFLFLKPELAIDDPEKFYNEELIFSDVILERTHKRKGFKLAVGVCGSLVWLMQVMRNNEGNYIVNFYFNNENIEDFINEAKMLDKLYMSERILRHGKRSNQTSTN